MVARLIKQLTCAGINQASQGVEYVRSPLLKLLERGAADRETHPKALVMPAHQIQQLLRGWPIALIRNFAQDGGIRLVVKVEGVCVKD